MFTSCNFLSRDLKTRFDWLKAYDKSTANRKWTPFARFAVDSPRILEKSAANPRHLDMLRCRRFAADS
jgi:hypothetical protein